MLGQAIELSIGLFVLTNHDTSAKPSAAVGAEVDDELAFSLPLAPEGYATEKAGFVRDDLYIFAGLEFDLLGIAATEVEMVPVEQTCGLIDSFLEELVPYLLTVLIQAAAAEVVLVGVLAP